MPQEKEVIEVQIAGFVSLHSVCQLDGFIMGDDELKESKQASDTKSYIQWIATLGGICSIVISKKYSFKEFIRLLNNDLFWKLFAYTRKYI